LDRSGLPFRITFMRIRIQDPVFSIFMRIRIRNQLFTAKPEISKAHWTGGPDSNLGPAKADRLSVNLRYCMKMT